MIASVAAFVTVPLAHYCKNKKLSLVIRSHTQVVAFSGDGLYCTIHTLPPSSSVLQRHAFTRQLAGVRVQSMAVNVESFCAPSTVGHSYACTRLLPYHSVAHSSAIETVEVFATEPVARDLR